jgi:hypothetical protein
MVGYQQFQKRVISHVTEEDRIPSDRNNFDRIRQSFCRIPFSRIPTRILSEFDGARLKSDQIRPGFHRVPIGFL